VVPKGRVLGLAVSLSDTEWTTPNDTGATVDVDLAHSKLVLPATGGTVVAPSNSPELSVDITTPSRRPDLYQPLN
jgi:X-Pro dipeptidyl-peptidase